MLHNYLNIIFCDTYRCLCLYGQRRCVLVHQKVSPFAQTLRFGVGWEGELKNKYKPSLSVTSLLRHSEKNNNSTN